MRFKLFEQFIINDTLNKRLFDDNNKLKEDVRRALLNVAEDFIDTVKEKEIPIKVYDCWLVGSNASYNYTDKSDIDLHIIVDSSVEGITPELLRLLYDYAKSSYNDKHNITVKGQEVEVYLEDINSNAITNGIYSLKKDAWIKFPKKIEVRAYDVTNSEKYVELLHKYSSITDEQIGDFVDELYMLRKESLAADGEFGEGNLIFKQLRNDGIIDALKDRLYAMKSKELTLENLTEELNEGTYRGQTELREFICDLLNIVCGSTLKHSDYMIHHKDFTHENYNPKNIVLLPYDMVNALGQVVHRDNANTSLHKRIKVDKTLTPGSSGLQLISDDEIDKYIKIIDEYGAIDVYRSLMNKKITLLDSKLLLRDMNKAKKHPLGFIR